MRKKVDEFFTLSEIESETKSVSRIIKLSNRFQRLYKSGKASFWNYFKDYRCGFIMVELESGYYVELYYMPERNLSNSRIAIEKLTPTILDYIDPMNIYKILGFDIHNFNSFSNGDGEKKTYTSILPYELIYTSTFTYVKSLYFDKSKYSRSECERWANFSLKSFVIFNKSINTYIKNLSAFEIRTLNDNSFVLKNVISGFDRAVKSLDLNAVTFTLEAGMLYNERHRKIYQEFTTLLSKEEKSKIKND